FDGNEARGRLGRDRGHRIGRRQLEVRGRLGRGLVGGRHSLVPFRYQTVLGRQATPFKAACARGCGACRKAAASGRGNRADARAGGAGGRQPAPPLRQGHAGIPATDWTTAVWTASVLTRSSAEMASAPMAAKACWA